MPRPRCIPSRRDPLFGGWLAQDTLTNILLNNSGPWSAKGNDPTEFLTRNEAQNCADMWNRLLEGHPRALHPAYRAYQKAQKARLAA